MNSDPQENTSDEKLEKPETGNPWHLVCVLILTLPIIFLGLWFLLILASFGVTRLSETRVAWGIVVLCGACLSYSVVRFLNPKKKKENSLIKDGPTTWWHRNGRKKQEGTFKNGKLDGLVTKWHDNGQKQLEGTFKKGKPEGPVTKWDKTGRLLGQATKED